MLEMLDEMVTSRLLALKMTSSPATGTVPVDQLVVVFQSPSVVPVQRTVAMIILSDQSVLIIFLAMVGNPVKVVLLPLGTSPNANTK